MRRKIEIKGASLHNLKHIDVEIPHKSLTVITGVSGSGKSSLAFDTIYAEGQRRFVESLSAYARQFLERMTKPEVEKISGILPAVSIEQKSPSRNPRSTVGTSTEVYDYIRLLFGRIGQTICYKCGNPVIKDNPQSVAEKIISSQQGKRIFIMFPFQLGRNIVDEVERFRAAGFSKILFTKNSSIIDLDSDDRVNIDSTEFFKVIVDRLVPNDEEDTLSRLTESLETAFTNGEGRIEIFDMNEKKINKYSNLYECAECEIVYQLPEPRLFSFNNPFGACHNCQGFGRIIGLDRDLVIPDKSKSLLNNAVAPFKSQNFRKQYNELLTNSLRLKIPHTKPIAELTEFEMEMLWNGDKSWGGLNSFFKKLEDNSNKLSNKMLLAKYKGYTTCSKCGGSRLRTSARQVFVGNTNIPKLIKMPLDKLLDFFVNLELDENQLNIAGQVLKEIIRRLTLLNEIGLEYITLDRMMHTLSGGEAQRISLSTAIGSSLTDTLYVLDEPSIGLHSRDTDRLISIIKKLKDNGNTVIVVEHDPDIMKHADHLIDMGPNAGEYGGEVRFAGSYEDLLKSNTLTSEYLSGKKKIEIKKSEYNFTKSIIINKPSGNNLKMQKIILPLNCLTVITGVSGSGKSTLVHDVIYEGISKEKSGIIKNKNYESIIGLENIESIEMIDQSSIGRSSRSTPITYTKTFDAIRDVFASTSQAKQMGCSPGYFSFNIPGGRCEVCEGEGTVKIDMQFLPDIQLVCDSCKGTRYKKEARSILFKGKSIVDVLNMSVDEALDFFKEENRIIRRLYPLKEIGLGYLRLGQSSSHLSGGESQRIKLASSLDSSTVSKTLFIFDEPTTGLHLDDISKLMNALRNLIEKGHSVLIIEHNLNVIANADYIIDLGPEGGDKGGYIVAEGAIDEIIEYKNSYTGKALKEFLNIK